LNVGVFLPLFSSDGDYLNRFVRIGFHAGGVGTWGATAAAWSSAKMDLHARAPWRTKYKANVCAAAIFSLSMCATAVVRSTARSGHADRSARRRASAAGWANPRTRITSADRSTWNGYERGGQRIRDIGARTGEASRLRYKTPLCRKSLKVIKIHSPVRYKTRFDAKVLY